MHHSSTSCRFTIFSRVCTQMGGGRLQYRRSSRRLRPLRQPLSPAAWATPLTPPAQLLSPTTSAGATPLGTASKTADTRSADNGSGAATSDGHATGAAAAASAAETGSAPSESAGCASSAPFHPPNFSVVVHFPRGLSIDCFDAESASTASAAAAAGKAAAASWPAGAPQASGSDPEIAGATLSSPAEVSSSKEPYAVLRAIRPSDSMASVLAMSLEAYSTRQKAAVDQSTAEAATAVGVGPNESSRRDAAVQLGHARGGGTRGASGEWLSMEGDGQSSDRRQQQQRQVRHQRRLRMRTSGAASGNASGADADRLVIAGKSSRGVPISSSTFQTPLRGLSQIDDDDDDDDDGTAAASDPLSPKLQTPLQSEGPAPMLGTPVPRNSRKMAGGDSFPPLDDSPTTAGTGGAVPGSRPTSAKKSFREFLSSSGSPLPSSSSKSMSMREQVKSVVKRSLSFRASLPSPSTSPWSPKGRKRANGKSNPESPQLDGAFWGNSSDENSSDEDDDEGGDKYDVGKYNESDNSSDDDDDDDDRGGNNGTSIRRRGVQMGRATKQQKERARARRLRRTTRRKVMDESDPALARSQPWLPSEVVLMVAGTRGYVFSNLVVTFPFYALLVCVCHCEMNFI